MTAGLLCELFFTWINPRLFGKQSRVFNCSSATNISELVVTSFQSNLAEKSSFFSSVANSVIDWELSFSIAQNIFGILLTHFSSQDSYLRFRSHCNLKNGLNIFEIETITKLNILTQTKGFPINHKSIINLYTVSRTFHSPFFGFKRRTE